MGVAAMTSDPPEESLPVVDPGAPTDPDGEDVAGVLLAAGESERFDGESKLLAELDGAPVVARAARSLTDSAVERVIAVVGHEGDRVRAALPDAVEAVVNPDYGAGQATSVGAGIRAAGNAEAVVVALGDMPRVRSASVDRLLAAFRAGLGDPLAAAHDGRRGNPVLFGAGHFETLAALEGDGGGRSVVLSAADAALVATGDPGVTRDVDSAADLERLREW